MSKLEKKMQHREFVQNAITRMNTNSFQIKGLAITIVSAFLAIYAAEQKPLFIIIPVPFIIVFWFLDTYYLQLERKFRGIYNDICGLNQNPITTKIYEINPSLYCGVKYNFLNVMFSITIWPLYLITSIGLTFIYFSLK
ncbi:hypothetical protein [Flavobacterium sp.]|jgi:hypothetical protein|uniref:hypothetical protein n=1 Tax=Flavobacterium sp. TaxID=239 RepID=UPI0022C4A687|nr:hypothetical protein [Flavobacterium sp.]MCZ8145308.1 hypothetical protein [Flavobacterium sp.]MCZ8368158.1 hypothetical protein [Flavobacterium sp.]